MLAVDARPILGGAVPGYAGRARPSPQVRLRIGSGVGRVGRAVKIKLDIGPEFACAHHRGHCLGYALRPDHPRQRTNFKFPAL